MLQHNRTKTHYSFSVIKANMDPDQAIAAQVQAEEDIQRSNIAAAAERARVEADLLEYQSTCKHNQVKLNFTTDQCMYCRKLFDMRGAPLKQRLEQDEIIMAAAVISLIQRKSKGF